MYTEKTSLIFEHSTKRIYLCDQYSNISHILFIMAKAFSESEQALIKEKLKKGAIEYVQRYGIRKVTVDELVKYAGISKGAFYLFYDSKELLFFDAIMEYHQQLHDAVSASIESVKGEITPDVLTETLFKVIKDNQSFWASLFANGDLEYMLRKLPKQISEAHLMDDDKFFNQFFQDIHVAQNIKTEIFSGALKAVSLTILHVDTIGEEIFDDVLKILLKSVFQQAFNNIRN